MMNKTKKTVQTLLLLILCNLILGSVNAQTESPKQKDSINSELLNDFNSKIKSIEEQRVTDSYKKADLQNELNALPTRDNVKKEKIQKQLSELNDKNDQWIIDKKAKIDSLRRNAKSFPVIGFFNDTLFSIYSKHGSFSAFDRANAITERLRKLTSDFTFSEKSLQVIESESTYDIVYGESIVMSISENDAIWNNTTKADLSNQYKDIIVKSVLHYKSETSLGTLAKEIGLALIVLSILGVLLFYCGKLFNWTAKKIAEQEENKIKSLTVKDYTLFDAKRLVTVLLSLNKLMKWTVIFFLIYISLPIVFGFFPWTQNFAQTLFGYIFNPLKKISLGIWNYLPNLFTIIVIFTVFRYAIRAAHFLKTEIENEKLKLNGFYPDWANPTFQIIKVVLYAFMFVLIFPYLPGSDSPVFQGVSVFLGFLFTFGSAGSLSNIIAGIVLTYMRLFKIGDRVKIGEVVGDVIEKSMLVTRVRTTKNEIISIPNSTVMSSHTVNYSNEAELGKGLIVHTTVTIGYDVPWKEMYHALENAADRTTLILKDPKPFVLQTGLEDFYVSYQLNAYTKDPNKQATIYSELHQHIQDCCNEAGIEIMSPHYRAERDGGTSTIPASYFK